MIMKIPIRHNNTRGICDDKVHLTLKDASVPNRYIPLNFNSIYKVGLYRQFHKPLRKRARIPLTLQNRTRMGIFTI